MADFDNSDWIRLVKRTRQKFGLSLEEAHGLIFADREMRRLIARRVNHNAECRKWASQDIKYKGDRSYFVRDGDRIRFRD